MGSPETNIGTGQVCDRCRQKRIKCDGASPSCRACSRASVACIVSAKLRRKTKIRGFQANAAEQVEQLRAENAELNRRLQKDGEDHSSAPQRSSDTAQHEITRSGPPMNRVAMPFQEQAPSVSTESQTSGMSKSALVIKHMGRLVLDLEGRERFAGSTTGVHFMLSVQEALRSRGLISDRFPESCYRLHLLQHSASNRHLLSSPPESSERTTTHNMNELFRNYTLSYFSKHILLFNEDWSGFYPIVLSRDLNQQLAKTKQSLQPDAQTNPLDHITSYSQMLMICLINSIRHTLDDQLVFDVAKYQPEIAGLLPRLMLASDLPSLQCLLIYSLYIQLTGQVAIMPQINGVMVQSAQSSGLHRHSRRFKFNAGTIEFRRRLWWMTYIFDKITALTHGIPQLIRDDDVDIDYPTDCELDEADSTQLVFPLPGETTSAKDFVACVRLMRIVASTLDQLYTTTHRRNGAEKINRLNNELQNWSREMYSSITPATPGNSANSRSGFTCTWLSLMKTHAMLMIHRPGLTFDDNTPQFRECLDICAGTCSTLIDMITNMETSLTVSGIVPFGPSLILQCGLIMVYYHHHTKGSAGALGPERSRIPQDSSASLVYQAQQLLQHCGAGWKAKLNPGTASDVYGDSILEAAQLLQTLLSLWRDVIEEQTVLPRLDEYLATNSHIMTLPEASVMLHSQQQHNQHQLQQQQSVPLMMEPGSLEDLNQMDWLDWLQGSPFGTFPDEQ